MLTRPKKIRADLLVVEQGLAETRTRAQALIMAGQILLAQGAVVQKPGDQLPDDAVLYLRGEPPRFVSRAGGKLQAIFDHFGVTPQDAVCLDVGQSTGGFTDCLLQAGAARVYGVDVGYGQLHWRLRADPRVVVIERENIRTLAEDALPEPADWLVVDVSFISLGLVLPSAIRFLKDDAYVGLLIKPQFEVGAKQVGKGGIVRDEAARDGATLRVKGFCAASNIEVIGVIPSPVIGSKGNQEFLLLGRREKELSSLNLI